MCGRFSLENYQEYLRQRYGLEDIDDNYQPRYNIAPSQRVMTLCNGGPSNRAHVKLRTMRFGMMPTWASGKKNAKLLINARSETVEEKMTFRESFYGRRCLIFADGFYEWRQRDRQPFRFTLRSEETFAFAGIWMPSNEGDCCVILTTEANATVAPIHARMPVILRGKNERLWIQGGVRKDSGSIRTLKSALIPHRDGEMKAFPVDKIVNGADHDSPLCVQPLS